MAVHRNARTLQDIIESTPSIVDFLRANPKGVLQFITARMQPTPFVLPEYTNWRDEQLSRRTTVGLCDQSYHMENLYVRGPDARTLLDSLAINNIAGMQPGSAKHFVACNTRGYIIGDAILYCLAPDEFVLVGVEITANWVVYHALHSGLNISIDRDPPFARHHDNCRTVYRFQVEGPYSEPFLESVFQTSVSDIPFFRFRQLTLSGHKVIIMRHSMTGAPGFELSGSWEDRDFVLSTLLEAGTKFGLRRIGSLAYFTSGLESGWFPAPLPAIYTDEDLRAYREWLPADAPEATFAIGGSYYSPRIEDYYVTPYELGYGTFINFTRNFTGRDALLALRPQRHRKKVTLVWDNSDFLKLLHDSLFAETPARFFDLPVAQYARWKYDRVENALSELIGISHWTGYLATERAVVSLALIDPEYAQQDMEVYVVWGECPPSPSHVRWLEPHHSTRIRARVAQVPISSMARHYWQRVKQSPR